jgi:hypothetical protein
MVPIGFTQKSLSFHASTNWDFFLCHQFCVVVYHKDNSWRKMPQIFKDCRTNKDVVSGVSDVSHCFCYKFYQLSRLPLINGNPETDSYGNFLWKFLSAINTLCGTVNFDVWWSNLHNTRCNASSPFVAFKINKAFLVSHLTLEIDSIKPSSTSISKTICLPLQSPFSVRKLRISELQCVFKISHPWTSRTEKKKLQCVRLKVLTLIFII